jgi:hypothetical protein
MNLFHVLGLCATLIGVFFLLAAILGARGPDGYIKGVALVLIGAWASHLGQTERPPPIQERARHAQSLTMAVPAALPPA